MEASERSALPTDARRGLQLLGRLAGRGLDGPPEPAPPGSAGFAWLLRRRIDALLDGNPLQSLYNRLWQAQRAALVEALTALEQAGVEAIVFKGAEFHTRYFDGRALGGMTDVDVLVRRGRAEAARRTLFELGYRHGFQDPEAGGARWWSEAEVWRQEAGHYELAQLLRVQPVEVSAEEAALVAGNGVHLPAWPEAGGDGAWSIGVGIDVHEAVAANVGGERFFAGAAPGTCGAGLSMGAGDLLWLTVSRWYSELALGKRSLREVAYVLPLLAGSPDWEPVLRAAADHRLGAALYYPLAFVRRAFGADVPDEVLRVADPRRTSRRRDWGWQLGPLLDVIEPPPV